MLGAATCFACLDSSAKWLGRSMDPIETASLRYLGSLVVAGAFLQARTRSVDLRTRSPMLQCGRALCLAGATLTAFFSFRYLPLAVTTSIAFAAPLIVALLSGPLLGEWIGPHRLVAVLVGFIGVLVVTRPGAGFHPAMLLSLLTALANAFYSIATRALSTRDSSETTLMYTGLVGSVVFMPALPFVWTAPSPSSLWIVILAMCSFGAFGHWLLILAHKRAPAAVLAPFAYLQILCAAGLGNLIFGEVPDRWSLAGGAIIIASGLYLIHRERVRRHSADIGL